MTTIRSIEQRDVVQVIRLAYDMHASSKYAHIPCDAGCVQKLVDAALAHDITCFVAVTHDAEVVGFIALERQRFFFSPQEYAADIAFYVKPNWRNTPAPLRLLRVAETWAKTIKASALVLGITAPENTDKVQQFYTRIGYKPWGVVMRKEF